MTQTVAMQAAVGLRGGLLVGFYETQVVILKCETVERG
jgi:hypothetical protein